MKALLGVLFCIVAMNLSAAEFIIDRTKQPVVKIAVNVDDQIDAEKHAVSILEKYLNRIYGVSGRIVSEKEIAPDDKNVIYVGWTQTARNCGVSFSDLYREEYIIRTGKNFLILTGGRTRGTLYAVQEFLERFGGRRFLAMDTEIIPSGKKLEMEKTDLRKRPAFACRILVEDCLYSVEMMAANKANYYQVNGKKWGFYERFGSPRDCHTFQEYSKKIPIDNPDYFALDRASGKRRVPERQGMSAPLCMTHPAVRDLVWKQMRQYVIRDRERAGKNGYPPPMIYDLSLDDILAPCDCSSCRKLTLREGAFTGPVLDFANDMAARGEKEFPGFKIKFLVYQLTLPLPRTLKPRDNVIVQVCVHDNEWLINTFAETSHPIRHPVNRKFHDIVKAWASISKEIAVWDYWVYYTKPVFPYIALDKYFDDFRFYQTCRAQSILVEQEQDRNASFFALKSYLALKLMDDPNRDRKELIDGFMKGYYGNAAPAMTDYLYDLDRSVQSEKQPMGPNHPRKYAYLNTDFFLRNSKLLDQAEKAVADSPLHLRHVKMERAVLDQAMLTFWSAKLSEMPLKKEDLLRRCEENRKMMILLYARPDQKEKQLQELKNFIEGEKIEAPLPAEIKGEYVYDFKYCNFLENGYCRLTPDADAVGGKAIRIHSDGKYNGKDFHRLPFLAGAYNGLTKESGATLQLNEVPQDEKYHLYKLGSWKMINGNRIYLHWTWQFQLVPREAFMPTPDYPYDIYVSLKFTGPSYVKNSKQKDGIFVDRIILSRN